MDTIEAREGNHGKFKNIKIQNWFWMRHQEMQNSSSYNVTTTLLSKIIYTHSKQTATESAEQKTMDDAVLENSK